MGAAGSSSIAPDLKGGGTATSVPTSESKAVLGESAEVVENQNSSAQPLGDKADEVLSASSTLKNVPTIALTPVSPVMPVSIAGMSVPSSKNVGKEPSGLAKPPTTFKLGPPGANGIAATTSNGPAKAAGPAIKTPDLNLPRGIEGGSGAIILPAVRALKMDPTVPDIYRDSMEKRRKEAEALAKKTAD